MEKYIKQTMMCIGCFAGIEIIAFLYFIANNSTDINFPLNIIINIIIILNCPMIIWRSNANKKVALLDKGIVLCMLALLVIPILDLMNIK